MINASSSSSNESSFRRYLSSTFGGKHWTFLPSWQQQTDENSLLADDALSAEMYVEPEKATENEEKTEMRLLKKSEIIILMLSYLGINFMFLILSVEVVPAQILALVGSDDKASVLGGMVAVGAVITFVSGPLIGMESDRLVTRFGRRRPIMVVASFFLTIGLLGMAFSAPHVDIQQLQVNSTKGNVDQCTTVDLELKRCRAYVSNESAEWNQYVQKYHRKIGALGQEDEFKAQLMEEHTSGHLGWYIPFYFLVIFSYVALMTPYNALVADRSHHDQRGLNSGVMGGMILSGNIGGAAMGLLITPIGVVPVYIISTVIVLLCIAITVIFTSEPHTLQKEVMPLSCNNAVRGFWEPLKDNDFRWVFITRFLMQMGVTSVVGFLEYWLSDMIELPNCWSPFRGVSMILLPMLVLAAASSVASGILSDRLNVRKPMVIAASITMAIVSGLLALLRGDMAYYIAIFLAGIFGIAFGGYQAVDFALLMDVLPDANEKSRDIAVWQQALVLPQALAVPIGGIIIDLFERVNCHIGLGYIIMFVVTSFYFMMSGIFVTRIRSSR